MKKEYSRRNKNHNVQAILLWFLCVAFAVLLPIPSIGTVAAGVTKTGTETSIGGERLDVIFVIDNSGSMVHADPDKWALSAANEFIDLCDNSDSRVGYVMYGHDIIAWMPLTEIAVAKEMIKNDIAATNYQRNADTDIALGLDEALSILAKDEKANGKDRKQVIILLSDGNTDLSNHSENRTTAEAEEALTQVTADLGKGSVPVYTIGFNHDGQMDTSVLQNIAESTGATFQEATSAEEIQSLMNNVYGDLTGSPVERYTIIATGVPQTFTFDVPDETIYKMTISIAAQNDVTDISIVNPLGNALSNITLNTDATNNYRQITLYYPDKGEWNITFTGTEGDTIDFNLVKVYEMALIMETPEVTSTGVTFNWHMEDVAGNVITDPELIQTAQVTLHANGDSVVEAFPVGQTTGTFTLAPGDYEAYLSLDRPERESLTQQFTVTPPTPATVLVMESPIVTPTGVEITWHLEDENGVVITDQTLIQDTVVTFHANADSVLEELAAGHTTATVTLSPGDYEAYLSASDPDRVSQTEQFTIERVAKLVMNTPTIDKDEVTISWHLEEADGTQITDPTVIQNAAVTFHANSDSVVENFPTGQTSMTLPLTAGDYNAYLSLQDPQLSSQTQRFTVEQTGLASWIIILIIAGAVAVLLVGIVLLLKKISEPYLDDPMSSMLIELLLPSATGVQGSGLTTLKLPHVRGKVALSALLTRLDQYTSYQDALGPINDLLKEVMLWAKDKTTIAVSAPNGQGESIITVDQTKVGKFYEITRSKGLQINIANEVGTYEFKLGNVNQNVLDDPFGKGGFNFDRKQQDDTDGFTF
ncbi:MAG: VWA domain-containing protein [Lachnospiraceae bacterium]|jgi:Mg-chelatase subunit ChlD|nr:VWA domain-containing protein [Lachnospiraceae bacterium]